MAPVVLSQFKLPLDLTTFREKLWIDNKYFETFLINKLNDLSVTITEWEPVDDSSKSLKRTIRSFHPSKISFPGLPSHAESWKVQTMEGSRSETEETLIIKEVNSLVGIPYADYFCVNTEWIVKSSIPYSAHSKESPTQNLEANNSSAVTSKKDSNNATDIDGCVTPPSSATIEAHCDVTIMLDFTFYKSTWLQGTIESNTKAELVGVYELWLEQTNHFIRQYEDLRQMRLTSITTTQSQQQIQKMTESDGENALEGQELIIDEDLDVVELENMEDSYSHYSDEELLYYDCEEGGMADSAHGPSGVSTRRSSTLRGVERNRSGGNLLYSVSSSSGHGSPRERSSRRCSGGRTDSSVRYADSTLQNRPRTPPELHALYDRGFGKFNGLGMTASQVEKMLFKKMSQDEHYNTGNTSAWLGSKNSSQDNSVSRIGSGESSVAAEETLPMVGGNAVSSHSPARDLAVTIVETTFVMAEFLYWQVHTFYAYELKELFNIEPKKVLVRIVNSFLPGWHSPVLIKPDMYGPLLAVFMLPQSLLYSVETSRHGCNPTSQLGNAVIVSLFIWLGLSFLYRFLAIFIAPTISLKQCLSVTGYSFFAWNAALLCLYPLESYKEFFNLPVFLPLVIFGIPSSIAQGYMFWEHTAASNLTLQPNAFPTSLQQCATQNSRWLQRLLWSLPKIVAFIVVAGAVLFIPITTLIRTKLVVLLNIGTHYQFLWYMARVFLPGRRQLCRLKALIQPTAYADILTQKELRKVALLLLSGKKNHA